MCGKGAGLIILQVRNYRRLLAAGAKQDRTSGQKINGRSKKMVKLLIAVAILIIWIVKEVFYG